MKDFNVKNLSDRLLKKQIKSAKLKSCGASKAYLLDLEKEYSRRFEVHCPTVVQAPEVIEAPEAQEAIES